MTLGGYRTLETRSASRMTLYSLFKLVKALLPTMARLRQGRADA